jgi:hypothetical protein
MISLYCTETDKTAPIKIHEFQMFIIIFDWTLLLLQAAGIATLKGQCHEIF